MPIESKHPLYEANITRWLRCRHAYEGEDAVKAAGTEYLPKIGKSQGNTEYQTYKMRASYYEAVPRTVDGFVGAVARKEHEMKLPAKLEVFLQDATGDGMGLDEYIKTLCAETMLIGRCGILCDFDDTKQRSFFSLYTAEAILNWSPTSITLAETVFEDDPKDAYKQKAVEQIRQLHLVDGVYNVTIWRKKEEAALVGDEWQVYETSQPAQRGTALAEIPFYWLSPAGQTVAVQKPALLGLVNLSMSHYRTSADLEHGRHFTGLPTLWVFGVDEETPILIGSGAAIVSRNEKASCGYAEFTGQGLGSLENALEAKERQMAVLGAAVFTNQRKGVEAAETARIRTSGENSLLMGVVTSVEDTLLTALQCAAKWMSVDGEITLHLNRDFVDQTIEPQTLLGMVAAYQAGAMSLESFLFNLDQAEMLPPDTDIPTEVTKLKVAADAQAAREAALAAAAGPRQIPGG